MVLQNYFAEKITTWYYHNLALIEKALMNSDCVPFILPTWDIKIKIK